MQLTEALAADTVTTLVHGLRSAILRTNSASSSASRGYSRDHQSRDHRAGAVSDDVSHIAPQCKALQTTLPHGSTLASSLKQVHHSASFLNNKRFISDIVLVVCYVAGRTAVVGVRFQSPYPSSTHRTKGLFL